MTFSQSVKNEILRSVRNVRNCCAVSFLTAVLKSMGSLTLGHDGYAFSVESDNAEFLTLAGNMAKEKLQVDFQIDSHTKYGKNAAVYTCKFSPDIGEKLKLTVRDADGALGFAQAETLIPAEPCCRRAFMQGLFVSCGSVVIPQTEDIVTSAGKAKYHLELRFTDSDFARAVSQSYSAAEFRDTVRKNYLVLYLKDSERIADFLVYVNATNAKLELENVIIARSVRNGVNRQNNCEVANIEKTVAAAAKQLRAIAALRNSGTYDLLPDNLKEAARLREADPEATLEEIADRLHVSKSGANHRFAKLIELAFNGKTNKG